MAPQKGWILLAILTGAPAWAGTTSDTAAVEDLDLDDDGVLNGDDPDPEDCDADDDGILDGVELGVTALGPDTAPGPCAVLDADPTTTTDPTLPDTDGGGLSDGVEDRNKNGRVDPWESDPLDGDDDVDQDGDGFPDSVEAGVDTDGDGIGDELDQDADDDGLLDADEGALDVDEDGLPGWRDPDSDNDGLRDGLEPSGDADNDGLPGIHDPDSDNDTIPDGVEGMGDLDGDDIPNALDEDADGNGVADIDEANLDTDCDGIVDALDAFDQNGFCDTAIPVADVEDGPFGQPLRDPDPARGTVTGGCQTVPVAPGWWGAVVLGLALRRRRWAALSLLLPGVATAQPTNLLMSRPAVDGGGLSRVPDPRMIPGAVTVGLDVRRTAGLARWELGNTSLALISDVASVDLGLAVDAGSRVRVGMRLPVHLVAGDRLRAQFAIGDAVMFGRVGVLDGRLGALAISSELDLPSGTESAWLGAPSFVARGSVVGALTPIKAWGLTGQIGVRSGRGGEVGGVQLGPGVVLRGGTWVSPVERFGVGVEVDADLGWLALEETSTATLLGTIRGDLTPNWRLVLSGGAGLTRAISSPSAELGLAVRWLGRAVEPDVPVEPLHE